MSLTDEQLSSLNRHTEHTPLLDPLEISTPTPTDSLDSEAQLHVDRSDWPGDPAPTLSSVFRHSGWAHTRKRLYDAFLRTMQPVFRITRFAGCGDRIHVQRSLDKPDTWKLAGSYCRDRWCTPCARDRAHTVAANILALAGKRKVRFATLTLRASAQPLELRLEEIRLAFSRLRRTSLWRSTVSAGIACLEVKRYANAVGWNVHYHLLLQGRYLPQGILSNTWNTITKGSPIVDVALAKSPRNVARYVTKYVTKPLDTSYIREPHLLDEAVVALKGVRLVDTFGAWRGKPITRPPDTGAWDDYCTLDVLLYRATHGDTYAAHVLNRLRSTCPDDAITHALEFVLPPAPRPPPPDEQQFLPWSEELPFTY
jgi:hypothetical protein